MSKSKSSDCHCGGSFQERGRRYIYPVPQGLIEGREFASHEGIVICAVCAKAAFALQVQQGLVIPVEREKSDGRGEARPTRRPKSTASSEAVA